MRPGLYIRVSTDDQDNSLHEQQERGVAYCKAMGWPSPIIYIDDGYSAKDINRPNLTKLLKSVENRKHDIIITTKLDRLSRRLLDILKLVEYFESNSCSYASISESFDTSTAAGKLSLQVLGAVAEFERERIRERVSENMNSLAKNTDKALTIPCYGYDIVDGKYVINEQEAQNVRFMFDLAEEGHGHRMIAKYLNDRGVRTKRGKMWDQINVKRLMNTETLTGTRVTNKRTSKNGKIVMQKKEDWIVKPENHPHIIPPERFERVKDIFRSRSPARKHADNESYLLTGLVKCKHCGNGMKGSTNRHKRKNKSYDYFRYICSSYSLGYGCKHHAVHRDNLEQIIIGEIEKVSKSSAGTLTISVGASQNTTDEIKEIESQLVRIGKRMQKQIEAYENDLISANDLKAARIRIESERHELDEKLEKLKDKKGEPETVRKNAKRLLKDITSIDRLSAKIAIRQLIDRIEVENGELISIVWRS